MKMGGNIMVTKYLKLALITSPIIAILITGPVFVISQIPLDYYPFVFLVVCCLIFFIWMLHVLLIFTSKARWIHHWPRIIIGTIITAISLYIGSWFINPAVSAFVKQFTLMRILNGLMINSIIFIMMDLLISKENQRQLDRQNEELKYLTIESEYQMLRSQLDPHFIFNSLETVKYLNATSPELLNGFIDNLSEFVRASIRLDKRQVLLSEELDNLKIFINLNTLRFENKFSFKQQLVLDTTKFVLPYFTLILLVENALKHNVFSELNPLNIVVRNDSYFLIVENDYRPKASLSDSTGIGLRNLSERINLMYKEEIIIEKAENIFRVKLKLTPNESSNC